MSRLRLAKIAAPSAPPATTAELFYSSTDSRLEAIDENGNIAVLGGFAARDYRLIRVLNITATGTYTPTAGTRALYVEGIGGGGGGGAAQGGTSACAGGGGGGSGGYSEKWLAGTQAADAPFVITVGAGGPGPAYPTNASSGGDTSVAGASTTTYLLAKGGVGGTSQASGTAPASPPGGAGGAASGGIGDLKVDGNQGMCSSRFSATQLLVSGASWGLFGGGVTAPQYIAVSQSIAAAGTNATTPGSGGGGGWVMNAAANASGGNGAGGWVRVWEFA